MNNSTKKTLPLTLSATQVKAMLRNLLVFKHPCNEDTDALCVDDPYVGVWVNWEVLDELIDKEFEAP